MRVDDALTLDWSSPAVRKAFGRGVSNGGTLSWHDGGLEVASVGFAWNATAKYIQLRYSANGVAHTQRIKVVETEPNFGGRRAWFWCEATGKPCRILVLSPQDHQWRSRTVARLAYRSQYERSTGLRRLLAEIRREVGRDRRNAIRRLRRRELRNEVRA